MSQGRTDAETPSRPLRLWPGVTLAALLLAAEFVVPAVAPGAAMGALLGQAVCALGIVVWWIFFSRARWSERLGGVGLIALALLVTPRFVDESLTTAGMGVSFYILAVPVLCLVLVGWAVVAQRLPGRLRGVALVSALALSSAAWTVLRTDGIDGDGHQQWAWRWAPTAEDLLLARAAGGSAGEPAPLPAAPAPPEWPGFRGPQRDGVVSGVRIETDWAAAPPVELWRRPIGPGWSSFAVHGDRLYTQEQRGEDEVVTCYAARTGEPVWRHRDAVRFWESHGGAGPRATPALAGGRVYTFGATGILNALDAADGAVVWSRDAAADTGAEVPHWGFTSSPLVVDDLVVVDTGTLVAYDAATGEPRWEGPRSHVSYSSPQRVTIDGVTQILLLSGPGAVSVSPADGAVLWEHPWPGSSIVQPNMTGDDVLLSATGAAAGLGTRRLAVARGRDGWTVEERWTSNGLKPYFSDFVVHGGHAYGFDGGILSCIDLETGERRWKGGRYGHGQMLLLPDQDLLLVTAERGDLALVSATPDSFTELARSPALHGKTWTHPVLVDDLLLVRNAEEMAAFRLAPAPG